MKNELDSLADSIAKRLISEGFTVQRYNAYTTNSIYLKLDYGVKEYRKEKDKFDRFYYRADKSKNMIKKIIEDREAKKSRYGEDAYIRLMQKSKSENAGTLGFWSKAVLLN